MNELLRPQARDLANRPYTVIFEEYQTDEGEIEFFAHTPELPNCMADGKTKEEARNNLRDAREDYILSLLEDNLPVPEPLRHASQSLAVANTIPDYAFTIASNVSKNPLFPAQLQPPTASPTASLTHTLAAPDDKHADQTEISLSKTS